MCCCSSWLEIPGHWTLDSEEGGAGDEALQGGDGGEDGGRAVGSVPWVEMILLASCDCEQGWGEL